MIGYDYGQTGKAVRTHSDAPIGRECPGRIVMLSAHVAKLLGIEVSVVWSSGKYRHIVEARSRKLPTGENFVREIGGTSR